MNCIIRTKKHKIVQTLKIYYNHPFSWNFLTFFVSAFLPTRSTANTCLFTSLTLTSVLIDTFSRALQVPSLSCRFIQLKHESLTIMNVACSFLTILPIKLVFIVQSPLIRVFFICFVLNFRSQLNGPIAHDFTIIFLCICSTKFVHESSYHLRLVGVNCIFTR